MSYSRWSNSCWYTFWTSSHSEDMRFKLPTKRLKDNQVFEICDLNPYYITYHTAKKITPSNFKKLVKAHFNKEAEANLLSGFDENKNPVYELTKLKPHNYSEEELNELYEYLKEFLRDVDRRFKLITFFKYEWYIPIKLKIKKYLNFKWIQ